jgi:hypothetical protein
LAVKIYVRNEKKIETKNNGKGKQEKKGKAREERERKERKGKKGKKGEKEWEKIPL